MTFRNKLFFAFLLLSFVPTAALITLSYRLATQGADLLVARGVTETLQRADSLAILYLSSEEERLQRDASAAIHESEDQLKSMVKIDSLFDFVMKLTGNRFISLAGSVPKLWISETPTSVERISNASGGREKFDDRLLIWQKVDADTGHVIFGRYLPEEYFRLAKEVFAGRTSYQNLSETLLPGGKSFLLKLSIAVVVAFLILALLTAQILSYSLSSPLAKLVDATKRISAGDLKFRIAEVRSDEIGELNRSFNAMTEKLESTTQNLIAAEREMTWRETARTIAHEIKNLLTPVNIALYKVRKNLEQQPMPDQTLEELIAVLTLEIEAISDLSKQFALFAQPPRLALSTFRLKELITEVISLYPDIRQNQEVAISVEPENLEINADRSLLRRLFSNLFKNSLEAMPYGGKIEFDARMEDQLTKIEVRDNGPGADLSLPIDQPLVTTKKTGTGLGLAIVKRICQEHNWQIEYGNLDPGFFVRIMIRDAHA